MNEMVWPNPRPWQGDTPQSLCMESFAFWEIQWEQPEGPHLP